MRKRITMTISLALSLAVFTALPILAGDWPMWGGGPNRNMVSSEKNIPRTWNIEDKTNIK